ncbi:2-polyprenylphenol 6-hydroxylase [Streptomyces mobaraensis NBRC 13819 = DSM 40847]|uniref:2-polyprenylphenol 6-hydroxylase n=1 Tax=Streptomyces mobaraensis (strain ATCC 29032 / DSM 40847 / JCM 4168 / NBRC 13819 / NCIMB 11159 / IPCR 16-22) TaxID=1223523 RepID=M3C0K4_STRM1|nr:2-polyprenylphenol 6-hydroxylase [Streptomyces mobaraensis NBRC 13819 = DSM 40847]
MEVLFDAMEAETDFRVEAANMRRARQLTQPYEHLTVPRVLMPPTRRVLVQSLAPGTSIRDADPRDFTLAQRTGIGRDLMAFMYHGFFLDRYFHADPHPGNLFVHPGEPAHLIDWGMVGRMDSSTSRSLVLALLTIADDLRTIIFGLARETLSERQAARTALDIIIAAPGALQQTRGILRTLADQDLTLHAKVAGEPNRHGKLNDTGPRASWASSPRPRRIPRLRRRRAVNPDRAPTPAHPGVGGRTAETAARRADRPFCPGTPAPHATSWARTAASTR